MAARRPSTSPASWRELVVVALALVACEAGGGAGDDAAGTLGTAPTGDDATAGDDGTVGDDGSADDAGDDAGTGADCTAPEVACGQICTDTATDPNNCGACGVSCVIPEAGAACSDGTCTLSACDLGFADCDGDLGNGCELPIDCDPGDACTTSCNSTGVLGCADPCAPTCAAPTEVCNALDDDCDGMCDQGPLAGCRLGIHRAIGGIGHFYTADANEIAALGLTTEVQNFFWLYNDDTGGLQPLFRCNKAGGRRFLTSSIDCETTGGPELTLGFMSNMQICGSIPLFRSYNAGSDDHFYTTSEAEHQNAIAMYGYADQGITGYVWGGA
ncbi:MAG TPA: hypothetical protein VFG69_09780 [Nannocystaceae bacterium]|nr:hypothetical protein [Nannocystaceae bacterium]